MTIGDEKVKVYLVVATLGYSRRLYVRPFRNERQESWFAGVEGAFRHFGGVTKEVLLDNDRGLAARHDRVTREVEFNARLHALITGDLLRISHAGHEVTVHQRRTGRFERVVNPVHFDGVVGSTQRHPWRPPQLPNQSAAASYCAR